MDALEQRLALHARIGLDTAVFIYHLEAHSTYLPVTKAVLAGVQAGHREAVTSVITLMELTVLPWRQQQSVVARQYEALLVHFPHLQLAEVTRDVARRAQCSHSYAAGIIYDRPMRCRWPPRCTTTQRRL